MVEAGLTVAFGHDCVTDPFYPKRSRVDAVTVNAARILGLATGGSRTAPPTSSSCKRDPVEALRLRAARLYVVRRGEVIAESPPQTALLHLPGRHSGTSFTGRGPSAHGS
jgi:cytosine deaminase